MDIKRITAEVEQAIKGRYKHRDGKVGRDSECGRAYNHYSIGCIAPPDGAVAAGRLRRSIDELVDAVSGETRHGLLVIRTGGIEVERLTDLDAPIQRLRLSVACHGSSMEEWDSSVRAIREQQL